jgi:hexosaminidase
MNRADPTLHGHVAARRRLLYHRRLLMRFLISFLLLLAGHASAASGHRAGQGEHLRAIAIVPQPASIAPCEGTFTLSADTVIYYDRANEHTSRLLLDWLAPATGLRLRRIELGEMPDAGVVLRLDASLSSLGSEGYALEVTPRRVVIRAAVPAGVFHGVQTLRQLLPPEIFAATPRPGAEWTMPCASIEDWPRFSWRGAHLDVSRHFMPREFVLKYIDLLALHKLNRFHWHLTDDQGWRVEIKKYPELTRVGSRRSETRLGPERDNGGFDGKPHGGFYTQAEIREVVAYAAERFITVVPEIEMPGHAQAAIAAYPRLGNTRERVKVWTQWGVSKYIFNPEEKTIRFLQNVLDEVLRLFPGEFIHIGGDEAVKDQWKASRRAQARIRKLKLKNEEELQSWFIRRMGEYLAARGRRLIGWDEILEGGLAPGATVMSWRGTDGGIAAARAGHDVVMAPNSHTYFDHYQSKDPGEPLAIGGFTPLEKVYSFEPIPEQLTPEEARRVLGAQAQLWTEYIPTPEHAEYMAYPRLCALAEVVWSPRASRDFAGFLARMRIHEQRLKFRGVNSRPLDRP